MRSVHQSGDATTYCVSGNEIQQLTEDILKKRIQLQQDDVICAHLDEIPQCTLAITEDIMKPVLASDGYLYNKDQLDDYLKTSNKSERTNQIFQMLYDEAPYFPIRLSFKNKIRSLINPNKYILNGRHLVFVGRAQDSSDSAAIMIESISQCEGDVAGSYFFGCIETYQFQHDDQDYFDGRGVIITHRTYAGLNYSQLTQYALLVDDFSISPDRVEARTYICRESHVTDLRQKIHLDSAACETGKIRYYNSTGSSSIEAYQKVRGFDAYSASSWARNVLNACGFLSIDNCEIIWDTNFKINPLRPPSFWENFTGITSDEIMPKTDFFKHTDNKLSETRKNTREKANSSCVIL